jgi:hypothetical protein
MMIKFVWTIDRVYPQSILSTNSFIFADFWQPWRAVIAWTGGGGGF